MIERILEEYRTGSADRRLSMFLWYRELRDEFARIEQRHPAHLYISCFAERRGRLRRLFRWLRQWLTRMSHAGLPDGAEP